MNETLSAEDRRNVRTSLIASLAFVFTFLLGGIAWAGTTAPVAASGAGPRAAAAASTPGTSASDERQNTMVGCGCAEACLVAN